MSMGSYDTETGITFGAQPGDEGVFAEFYLHAVQNNFLSEKEGRPIFEDKLYIRIRSPGDRRNEVDREAKDGDKRRFPRQWMLYNQGASQATTGTPLEEWPQMTPASVKNLKSMDIHTMEGLAAVTDGNLATLGMGARVLRDGAISYLERAKEGAGTRAMAAENADLRAKLEALEANFADLAAASRRKAAKDD